MSDKIQSANWIDSRDGVCYISFTLSAVVGAQKRGNSSVVEHHLAKVGVEGSNPFSRSPKFEETLQVLRRLFFVGIA